MVSPRLTCSPLKRMDSSACSERFSSNLSQVVLPEEPAAPTNHRNIDQVLQECEKFQKQLADMHLKIRLEKYKNSLTPSQDPHKKKAYQ